MKMRLKDLKTNDWFMIGTAIYRKMAPSHVLVHSCIVYNLEYNVPETLDPDLEIIRIDIEILRR